MDSKIRASIGPAISGVLSGLVVAVYFSLQVPQEDQPEIPDVNLPAEKVTLITTDQETQDLARLNRSQIFDVQAQLDQLKKHASADTGAQHAILPEATPDESADYKVLSDEEAVAADYAWWDNLRTQVQLEEYDSIWAPAAENNFQHDFDSLASGAEFTLVNTDCRTTRCAITVEFSSYATASENFSKLLHHEYKTNCARHTLLPKPDRSQGESPYQATFIFECDSSSNTIG